MLTIEKLKKYYLPLNVSRVNNYQASAESIAVYNDSINLYKAIKLVVESDFTPTYSTDLTSTPGASSVLLESSTGTDATILAATTSLAGVMSSTDKVNLNSIITLSGVTAASTHLGTFTGGIIQDSRTIKQALQDLETGIEDGSALPLGNLTSANSAITVTSGTDAIFVPTGVTLTFNPASVDIGAIGGTIDLSQIDTTSVVANEYVYFNGTNWAHQPFPTHNTLTSLQGGTTNQYYHLTSSLYDVLASSPTSRLIGRSNAGTGAVHAITLVKSIGLSAGGLQLTNDSASPPASYYYGTNSGATKGWFALPSTITTVAVTDSADIDFTITNPTTTPTITGVLTESGVIDGTYGDQATIPQIEVDTKGRILSVGENAVSIESTNVTDFSEAVDDRVNALLVAGSGISLVYSDGADTLTISSSATYTDEAAQDAIGTILTDSADIDFTYSDATPSITAVLTATGVSASTYGSALGTSYPKITVDDKGRITSATNQLVQINTTQINSLDEAIDDRVSTLLQAGTDITLSYNDAAGTLTINSTAGGGGGAGYDTIQEEGSVLTTRTVLNFIGAGLTAVDNAGSTRTDVSLDDTLNALAAYNTDGILVQTAADTFAGREIAVGSAALTITNGDGVSGNPTLDLDASAVDVNDFSGPLLPANGGSGLSALGTGNQLLGVDNGATASEYKTLTGTTNQVTVTHGTGTITLTTPQNIHTSATPIFNGVLASGTSPYLAVSASGSNDATITAQATGTGTAYLTISGDLPIAYLSDTTSTGSSTGGAKLNFENQYTADAGERLGLISFAARGASSTQRIAATISAFADETFTNSTSAGYLSFLTTPTTTTASVERLRINSTGEIEVRSGNALRFYDSDDSNYVAIEVPATGSLTSNYTLTLPTTDGDADEVLTTDGSGNLSWSSPASIAALINTIYTGDGTISSYRNITLASGTGYFAVTGDDTLFEQGDDYFNIIAVTDRIDLNNGIDITAGNGQLSIDSAVEILVGNFLGTPLKISLGSDATGDIFYRNSGGYFTRLPIGSAGEVLTVTAGLPAWETAASGGSPAGANYQLQYYNSGAFGADSNINVTPGAQPKLVVGTSTAAATLHARNHNSAGSSTLLTENSSGNNIFQVLSSGILQLGDNELTPRFWQSATTNGSVSYTSDGITFQGAINSTTSDVLGVYHANSSVTSGTTNAFKVLGGFNPSSGSATYAGIRIAQTINQTGTADGDTYGLIVAPTLTSVGAGGYRGIYLPYSDASAWGIYQDGTASPNFFAGNVAIGTTGLSAPAYELEVDGEVGADHFIGTGSAPAVVAGTSSVIGTGASVSISGTDSAYTVTLNTGTGASTSGNAFVVTFATPYANAPLTVWSPSEVNAATADLVSLTYPYDTNTTTTMSFYVHAIQASTTYKWTFHTIGK